MIFTLIALLIAAANIAGCIHFKKPIVRVFLGGMAGIWLLITAMGVWFVYVTRYEITQVDVSTSPDGTYELYFQQEGDPEWPYGYTHAQLTLKKGSKTVTKYSFDIANDGANIHEDNWSVVWESDRVSVAVKGDEQPRRHYILYFDGKTETK
jgi:hypothetical protein